MIRVLIVDDSKVARMYIRRILEDDEAILVVGEAADGEQAIKLIQKLHPDVITMDIRMPKMDGFEVTKWVMSQKPTPILVVSASVNAPDLNIAFNSLEAGALAIVEKPPVQTDPSFEGIKDKLLSSIKMIAHLPLIKRRSRKASLFSSHSGDVAELQEQASVSPFKVVGIASSTGGPRVLKRVFERLPKDYPLPILVSQHIAGSFLQGFVDWLNQSSPLEVTVAKSGDSLETGRIYVSPVSKNMVVTVKRKIGFISRKPDQIYVPSGDMLLESVAAVFGDQSIGVVLTGMGSDGVHGLEQIYRAGGLTLAQDEFSSMVYGMPRLAHEKGIVERTVDPDSLCELLRKLADASN